jgi:hypothetical protein
MDDWLDFLAALASLFPWNDPLRPARRHRQESDARLRTLGATETAVALDRARRDAG